MPCFRVGTAVAQQYVATRQLRTTGRRDPLEQRHHPALECEQLRFGHRFSGLVGPALRDRPRVGIVGQPLGHPNAFAGAATQQVSAEAEIGAFLDPGQRAYVTTRFTATDLTSARDQHDSERIAAARAVPHQRGVARLEDAQRQVLAGQ
ncbi:hypothetical protein A4G26_08805 [Mycobacterium kansasii]|nr:hypothetical protein A4G26_08805 [Mycobacterium kansasii]